MVTSCLCWAGTAFRARWNNVEAIFVNLVMEELLEAKPGITDKRPGARWAFSSQCLWVLIALLAASAVALRVSIMTESVRLLLIATILFGLFTGLLYLFRLLKSYPRAILPSAFFFMLVVVWAVLGNKPYNVPMLQNAYIRRLTSLTGVRYVRGGETNTGIDCSGLARVALWQAMLKQGVRQVNPGLLGPRLLRFWWRDVSAETCWQERTGYTRPVGSAPMLAGWDTSKLHQGDLAITRDGVHVLIFMGGKRWVEADPGEHKVVVKEAAANSTHGSFRLPVVIMRWRALEFPKAK